MTNFCGILLAQQWIASTHVFASMYIDCSLKLKDGGYYKARVYLGW
jgi:hypothetical protein